MQSVNLKKSPGLKPEELIMMMNIIHASIQLFDSLIPIEKQGEATIFIQLSSIVCTCHSLDLLT